MEGNTTARIKVTLADRVFLRKFYFGAKRDRDQQRGIIESHIGLDFRSRSDRLNTLERFFGDLEAIS